MRTFAMAAASAFAALFLGGGTVSSAAASPEPLPLFARSDIRLSPSSAARLDLGIPTGPHSLASPEPLSPPPSPPPPTPRQALHKGVLIVVSQPAQQAFVFRHGDLWDSTPVSTGKAGHETPDGVFPILQKKVDHRSSLYDDAPMPFMQRLTWDGVALHAGRVPGYPASHGCIRLPGEFAKRLYEISGFSSTIVVVTDRPLTSAAQARKLA